VLSLPYAYLKLRHNNPSSDLLGTALKYFFRNNSYHSRLLFLLIRLGQILHIEDHPDHKTATRAHSDLLAVAQVIDCNLEAVAARARVCVSLQSGIVGHVLLVAEMLAKRGFAMFGSRVKAYLDLDLVVDVFFGHFGGLEVLSCCLLGNSESWRSSLGGGEKAREDPG
jgi:hypothetical protein